MYTCFTHFLFFSYYFFPFVNYTLYDLNSILMHNFTFVADIHFRNLNISVFVFLQLWFLAACMIIRGRGFVFEFHHQHHPTAAGGGRGRGWGRGEHPSWFCIKAALISTNPGPTQIQSSSAWTSHSQSWIIPGKRRRPCSWWQRRIKKSNHRVHSSEGCSGETAVMLVTIWHSKTSNVL